MENYTRKEVGANGSVYHYNSNGNYHRLDGPAIEYATGGGYWFFDGKLHKTDGPAIVWGVGYKEWWINNVKYSKSCHNKLVLFSILESQRFDLSPTED